MLVKLIISKIYAFLAFRYSLWVLRGSLGYKMGETACISVQETVTPHTVPNLHGNIEKMH